MDEPLQAGLARFISRCDYNKIAEKFVDDANGECQVSFRRFCS